MEAVTLWSTRPWNSIQWYIWLRENSGCDQTDGPYLKWKPGRRFKSPRAAFSVFLHICEECLLPPQDSPTVLESALLHMICACLWNVARNPAATGTATICAVDALSVFLVMLNYGGSEFTDVLKRLKTVCVFATWAGKSREISNRLGR